MNEPLKDKRKENAGFNDNPIGCEYYDEGWVDCNMFFENDIKCAVEWLRNKLCDCKNISPHFKKCYTCEKIDEAFEDVVKIHNTNRGK